MPAYTPFYNLGYFKQGDAFSASIDRRRFLIIDNEVHFIAEQIGDGIIDGWQISDNNATAITVSKGVGLIDAYATFTFGTLGAELTNNTKNYIWMRRKDNFVWQKSSLSNASSIQYTDSSAPSAPAAPSLTVPEAYTVNLSWTANAEPDVSSYEIYRSSNNVSYSLLATTTDTSYVDLTVEQNSTYYYKLKAVDLNGNISGFGPVSNIQTLHDTSIPTDPTNVETFPGNQTVQVLWDASISPVDSYVIHVQKIDTEFQPDGSPFEITVGPSDSSAVLTDLINGKRYEITVYAVNTVGNRSSGVRVYGTPAADYSTSAIINVDATDYALDSSWNVAIDLSWQTSDDPYDPYFVPPAYFFITITAGTQTSERSIYTENSVTLVQYTLDDGTINRIVEDTKYTILIQPVDADGNAGKGTKIRFHTRKFSKPAPVSNLAIDAELTKTSASVNATWSNSNTEFSYNLITVRRVSLDSLSPNVTIENGTNIGKSETYYVPKHFILNKTRYEFEIIAVDHYGNQSQTTGGSAVISIVVDTEGGTGTGVVTEDGASRPGVPDYVDANPGDHQVAVSWSRYNSDFVASYNVYRATFSLQYSSSSFVKIATVGPDVYQWIDYEVTNGTMYSYFVTVTETSGLESFNPSDGYVDYVQAVAKPKSYTTLIRPQPPTVSASGYNANLTWAKETGDFDGFEIYRSFNGGLYTVVGSAYSTDVSYTDTNALLASGTYSYRTCKYQNEANLVITTSNIAPTGCVLLGVYTVANGSIVRRDTSSRVNIKNVHDPIRDLTRAALMQPHHMYQSASDDRRIRLSTNLVVEDWLTLDYTTYSTTTNIKNVGQAHVYINGQDSPYNYHVDKENGQIVFDSKIYDSTTDTTEPIVRAVFENGDEITGTIQPEQIEDISATKITKGVIDKERLPNISHFGRYKERCYSTPVDLTYQDGFSYQADPIECVTFYDIAHVADGNVVAATSSGIRLSNGGVWDVLLETTSPVTRIYFSPANDWYFASVGNRVYFTDNLTAWSVIDGMTAVNVIRDFTEDSTGNVFVTTDTGVYKLDISIIKKEWTQTSLTGPEDNNAYGIIYDDSALIVSLADGLYKSTDSGITWSKLSDNNIRVPVYSIIRAGNCLFAASKNNIWRLIDGNTQFEIISNSAYRCRKIVEFGDVLFLTTDNGILKTNSALDIYTESYLGFYPAFDSINRNNVIPPATCLTVSENRLYIGSDNRLYSADAQRKLYLHADIQGIAPTFYVNGSVRNIGVYYATNGEIRFDEHQPSTNTVSVVTQYSKVSTPNGGWSDVKYDAQVFVHINNTLRATGKPSTSAKSIVTAVKNMTLASFNARNSNYNTALSQLKQIVQLANELDQLDETAIIDSGQISLLLGLVDKLNTNVHPDVRQKVVLPAITANLLEIPSSLSTSVGLFSVPLSGLTGTIGTFNASTGEVDITGLYVDKYTTIDLSIRDVAIQNTGKLQHDEIETEFEKVNSGLSAPLSFVQQGNTIRLGLEYPDNGYQASYAKAYTDWYNKLDSTLDYALFSENTPDTLDIVHPTDAVYVSSKSEVWVGGSDGVVAIDASSKTRKVFKHDYYILSLCLSGGTVYALAQDGLYLIDVATGNVEKDVDITLPNNYTSLSVFNDNTIVATVDGLYVKRPFDIDWRKVITTNDASVHRSSNDFVACIGRNPSSVANGQVFYSTGGGSLWDKSSDFTDIIINAVVKRYDKIYYATEKGLYVEDLSRLYSNSQFDRPTIELVDVFGDEEQSMSIRINDIDCDNDRVVAGGTDGTIYIIEGGAVSTVQSSLKSIHTVILANEEYWIFGHDLAQREFGQYLIKVSTGRVSL